jgi:hypothetical protein
MKARIGTLVALVLAATGCSDMQMRPIVIDLSSQTPTPTPVAVGERRPETAASPAPAATPTPASAPAPPAPAVGTAEMNEAPPIVLNVPRGAKAPPAPSAAGGVTEAPDVSAPESVVDAQIDAFNRRDLDAFLSYYSSDAKVYDHPDRLRWSGKDALRKEYAALFSKMPTARVTVASRILQAPYVIDQEELDPGNGQPTRSVVTYQVRAGRIVAVWIQK